MPRQEKRTLAVDIGGSGVKCLLLDEKGEALTDRLRLETPDQPTPEPVIDQICEMAGELGDFDRISAGFPGVVVDGEVRTAVNLHEDWVGFNLAEALEKRLGRPTRVANDADVQGLGVIEGKGVELVLTLGTFALSGLAFWTFISGVIRDG